MFRSDTRRCIQISEASKYIPEPAFDMQLRPNQALTQVTVGNVGCVTLPLMLPRHQPSAAREREKKDLRPGSQEALEVLRDSMP